jgi:hypothetical protein
MNNPEIIKIPTTEEKKVDTLVKSLPNWDLTPPFIMTKKVVRK